MSIDYSLDDEFKGLPDHIDRASFFLGIAAYQNLMTKAMGEPDHKQETIVALLHFEVDTEIAALLNGQENF